MQLELRPRVKTQAALPNEGAVLRVFLGLWISGQMKLHLSTATATSDEKKKLLLRKRIS
jgi:hypothetical protein